MIFKIAMLFMLGLILIVDACVLVYVMAIVEAHKPRKMRRLSDDELEDFWKKL